MSASGKKLSVPYDNGASVSFLMFNRAGQFVVAGTGAVEAYNAANLATYKIAATPLAGLDLHMADVPALAVKPEAFSVLALDDADDGIVGGLDGEVFVGADGDLSWPLRLPTALESQNVDGIDLIAALRYAMAVLAGKVSGVGSGTETFVGLDGATDRVQSTIDGSGNRTAVSLDP